MVRVLGKLGPPGSLGPPGLRHGRVPYGGPWIRNIIIPAGFKVERTIQEVVSSLSQDVIGGPRHYDPDLYNKMREELMGILPVSQDELPPRRMLDSYDAAIIPLGSNRSLRDRYCTIDGGVRIGRLLEDMDVFAVHLVFKHVLNPRQKEGTGSPFSIVTALVDQIDFTGKILSDSDIRISGHVTWVGRSSAESTLYLEQEVEGEWRKMTEASFVLVARDPLNRGSAVINPMEVQTPQEKHLFQKGEENKIRRYSMSQDSLFRVPPSKPELEIIHDFFIRTVDHNSECGADSWLRSSCFFGCSRVGTSRSSSLCLPW